MVVFFHGFRYLVHRPSSFIVVRTAYKVVSTPAAIRSARIVRAPANPKVVFKVLFDHWGDGFTFFLGVWMLQQGVFPCVVTSNSQLD